MKWGRISEKKSHNTRGTFCCDLYLCVATIEWDELLMYKSPLLLPLFSVVFQRIYVKKVGGGVTPPGKLQ